MKRYVLGLWCLAFGLLTACSTAPGAREPGVTVGADPRVITVSFDGTPGQTFDEVSKRTFERTANAVLKRDYQYFLIVDSASEQIPVTDPRHPFLDGSYNQGAIVVRTRPLPLNLRQLEQGASKGDYAIFTAEVTVRMYTVREALRYDLELFDAHDFLAGTAKR